MLNIKKRILELRSMLDSWAEAYYEFDKPIVSDLEYDAAYNELVKLELDNPGYYDPNSITQRVGGKVDKRFKKVAHKHPMLSLSNAFDSDDLLKFDKQIKDVLGSNQEIEYAVELKIDGLSISLTYENGKLVRGVTRGNGEIGEDVTHNILMIENIPKEITCKDEVEFRGEIYMPISVFNELNVSGEKLANARNAAAGTLRQLDSLVARRRRLKAFIYAVPIAERYGCKSHKDTLAFIKTNGFDVNPETRIVSNINEVISEVERLHQIKKSLDYDTDGIVIKVNDLLKYEDIGFTVKFPKFMIAYKFPEEIAFTKLLRIFPTVGRTGRITYNAQLSPVRLGGSTVSAATLHNADYVREIDVNEGDVVLVKKAAEIIPKVLGCQEKHNHSKWNEFTHCPACHEELIRNEGEVDQYCINPECPQKNIASLEHFVSRNAMNIEGVSSEILTLFVERGLITDLPSIFDLPSKAIQILQLPGFKAKSVQNICESIEKAKVRNLDAFLFALGIRHVGEKNATILAKRFGTLEELMNASLEDLNSIREIGPKVSDSVFTWFRNPKHLEILNEFKNKGVMLVESEKPKSDIFRELTFVITGTLSKPREEFKKVIEQNGGNTSSSISRNTSYLLAGKEAGSKLDKAKELKVKVINEVEFYKLLGEINE